VEGLEVTCKRERERVEGRRVTCKREGGRELRDVEGRRGRDMGGHDECDV